MPPLPPGSVSAIRVGGIAQPALRAALLDLTVEDGLTTARTCALTVLNWGVRPDGSTGFLHTDRSLLAPDTPLSLEIGPDSSGPTLFEGHVTGLDGRLSASQPPALTVTAESDPTLRGVPRKRVFENVRRSDVLQTLAGEHGLVSNVTLVRDVRATVTQAGETDLAFVVRLARASGADAWVRDGTLYARDRRARPPAEDLTLAYGDELLECTARTTFAVPGTSHAIEATAADLSAHGHTGIHPGRIVDLRGVGALHIGRYLVTRVTHTFDLQHGFRTRCSGDRLPD